MGKTGDPACLPAYLGYVTDDHDDGRMDCYLPTYLPCLGLPVVVLCFVVVDDAMWGFLVVTCV